MKVSVCICLEKELISVERENVSGECLLAIPHLVLQGKEVSQESVKQFYENWMSRQNTVSSQEDLTDALPPPSPPLAPASSRHTYAKLKNQASKVSWGSSVSRWVPSVCLPVSA